MPLRNPLRHVVCYSLLTAGRLAGAYRFPAAGFPEQETLPVCVCVWFLMQDVGMRDLSLLVEATPFRQS
jgi:hypothetical protein